MISEMHQPISPQLSFAANTHRSYQRRSTRLLAIRPLGFQSSVVESAVRSGRASILSPSITVAAHLSSIASPPTTRQRGYVSTQVCPHDSEQSTRRQLSLLRSGQSPARSHVATSAVHIFASHTASSAASIMQRRSTPFAMRPETPNPYERGQVSV